MARQRAGDRLERALERPSVDYVGAAIVTAALVLLSTKWVWLDLLGQLSAMARLDLYGRLIAPLSIVASIATAGLAIYASASGPTVTLMRGAYGSRILKQFRGAAAAAGLAVVVLLAAYVAQAGYQADWVRWVVLGTVIFVAIRAARVLYFYGNVLVVVDEDRIPAAPLKSLDDQPVPRSSA